jgi:hypothetical protein
MRAAIRRRGRSAPSGAARTAGAVALVRDLLCIPRRRTIRGTPAPRGTPRERSRTAPEKAMPTPERATTHPDSRAAARRRRMPGGPRRRAGTLALLLTAGALLGACAREPEPREDAVAIRADTGEPWCELHLEQGLTLTADGLRVGDPDGKVLSVAADGTVTLPDGSVPDLDAQGRAAARAYVEAVRDTIPPLLELARDGVDVGLAAVEEAIAQLADEANQQELLARVAVTRERVREALAEELSAADGEVRLEGSTTKALGDPVGTSVETALEELEPVLETLVRQSVGEAVMAIGEALSSEEEDLFATVETYARRAQALAKAIEERVEPAADALQGRARDLCRRLERVDGAEDALHRAVPETGPWELLERR